MTENSLPRFGAPATHAPLKILYIVESAATGVGRHLFDLLDGILAQGHKVDVVYSPVREDDIFRRGRALHPDILFRAIPMRRAPGPTDVKALMAIRRHIHRFGPYDIIHGHSSKGGMLARLAGIGTASRVVYTPHAISTLNPALSRLQRLLVGAGEVVMSHLTDAIVAVSSGERDQIIGLGIPPAKVALIANEIGSLDPAPRDSIRRALNLAPEQVAIGFVGRLSRQKAIDVMVAAFTRVRAMVPQARLIVIGEGDAAEAARRQAVEAGCAEAISWLGTRDASRYYAAFDILALPSRYEGLSYTLLEAASVGLPIIASDVGGARDIVTSGVDGVVVPAGDAESFAAELCALMLAPERLKRYAAAAKRRLVQGGPMRMVCNTLALYSSLLSAPAPKRRF